MRLELTLEQIAALVGIIATAITGIWAAYTFWQKRRIKLRVIQRGSNITNHILTTDYDGTGCTLEVAIINDSPIPVTIRGFHLELPWNDDQFDWVMDPRELEKSPRLYLVPGTLIEFERDLVLNHRTYAQGRLDAGEAMEGMLVGFGPKPIPADFRHNSEIEMRLSVYDQAGRPHSELFRFRVDSYRRERNRLPDLNRH